MDYRDRRTHPRLEGTFHVDLLNTGDDPRISQFEAIVNGEALDVSRSGMRLKVTYDVAVGTMLSVIVYYRRRESICLCRVMWRREVMGEQLYGLFVSDWSRLDRFLEKELESMEIDSPPSSVASTPAAVMSVESAPIQSPSSKPPST
jgi:hypothetical protein